MATLLKWSSGAKPGLKRINKPSPTPLSERKKKYEDHRKQRSFQNSWTIGRSWLKDTLVAQLSEVPKQKGVRVETSGKAKGLRKLLLNKDVISFSMHMIDVLLPLKRLSLFLQQECSLAAEVHALMQDTLTALREYQDSNYKGIYSEKVHSNYFEGAAFIPSRTGPNLECEVEKFVTGLICNLQKRLTPGTDIVLQATNVANLIAWPENDSGIAAIRSFGNDEMTTVVEHYKEQLMFPKWWNTGRMANTKKHII